MTVYETLQLFLVASAFGSLTGFSLAAIVYGFRM